MKILMLTSVYKDISLGNEDTSTNIVNSFVHEWVKQGHEVIVIHNCHCYPKIVHLIPVKMKKKLAAKMGFEIANYKAVNRKQFIDEGVKVYRLPIKKYIPHRAASKNEIRNQINGIRCVLKKCDFVPDVITGHWASPQMEIISELKKVYNCKTACVLHGMGYIGNSNFDAAKYLKGVDHLGTRSVAQSKQVRKMLNLTETPFVCYSGIPDAYISKYQLNTSKFENVKKWKFIYVGRLVAYKNIDATIKSLHKLNSTNWEFDIIGDGAERNNLEKLVQDFNLGEQIHFCGRISREDVMKKLNEAHIFVMISTNEIFGLAYLEAMAASCITIASINGGVDGVIVNGVNGFLCSEGNNEELSEILENILNMAPQKLKHISNEARSIATEYTDSIVAKRYLELITFKVNCIEKNKSE